MATSQEELDSKRVFQSLKQVVSNLVQNFGCDDDAMKIEFSVDAEPFEVHFKYSLHPSSQLLTLYSKLNFTVDEQYRDRYAGAICELNYERMYGATFDFSPTKGFTVYRAAVYYQKSLISRELLESFSREAYATVTKYSQYLYNISHGVEAELPAE